MIDKEWLNSIEMAEETGLHRGTLCKFARKGKLPSALIFISEKNKYLFHRSLIERLREEYEKHVDFRTGRIPKNAIQYDGFILTPDEIRRLEVVRNLNGYRAIHWTNKTVEELIAIGGDLKENR